MAKKIKKAARNVVTVHEPNPFAGAYAARLERQVAQELTSARQATIQRKKKVRSAAK